MEETIEDQPTATLTKPRNAFIAFLLSLLIPGLGQVYNGQLTKAAFFFCLPLLLPLLFGVTRAVTVFYGLLALIVMELVLRIIIVIDAVRNAKKQQEYILKPYNTWYYHLVISIGMLTIIEVYDLGSVLGIQTLNIVSESGNPTFHVGDMVVADIRAYKNSEPDYGDVLVYSGAEGQIYTFRVVGKPNDKIELVDNIVSVNGKPSRATFIKEMINEKVPVLEFEEELPNGHKHLIYKFKRPYYGGKPDIKDIVVPADHYYLLGDNRDNAADSRYAGFINKDKIKGRIIYSYWGRPATKRMNIDFTDK